MHRITCHLRLGLLAAVMAAAVSVVSIGALAPAARAAGDAPLVFVADEAFPPFSFIQDGAPAGSDVELFREAAARAGFKAEIRLVPWARLIPMLQKGECAGAIGLLHLPARDAYAAFALAHPLHLSTYALYVKRGDRFPFDGVADLKGRTVGRVDELSMGLDFDRAASEGIFHIVQCSGIPDCIMALFQGRVDAFVSQTEVASYLLKRMGMTSTVTPLHKPLRGPHGSFVAVSRAGTPDAEALAGRIDEAMRALVADGSYRKLMVRYYGW
ncbi:MAG: substrate-binding periplasmic protein [Desulfovibrionaceae bacterium]